MISRIERWIDCIGVLLQLTTKTSHRRYYMQMSYRIRLCLRNNYIRIVRWSIHHRINETCVLANDVPTFRRNAGISFVRLIALLTSCIALSDDPLEECSLRGAVVWLTPFLQWDTSKRQEVDQFFQRIPCKQAGSASSFCEQKRVYGLYVHTQKQWNICYPWKKPVVVSLYCQYVPAAKACCRLPVLSVCSRCQGLSCCLISGLTGAGPLTFHCFISKYRGQPFFRFFVYFS